MAPLPGAPDARKAPLFDESLADWVCRQNDPQGKLRGNRKKNARDGQVAGEIKSTTERN